MPLTLNQQRAIVRTLPAVKRAQLKQKCVACEMKGEGFLDILKSAGKFLAKELGPIAKEIGPVVLKEIVVPLLKNKVGLGLKPAGGARGKGLRLAGQRHSSGRKRAGCVVTKKSQTGRGLTPAGGGKGSGLRLAGQRGKSAKRTPQSGKGKTNPWLAHVKKVRAKNPGMAFKDVLKKASKTWNP